MSQLKKIVQEIKDGLPPEAKEILREMLNEEKEFEQWKEGKTTPPEKATNDELNEAFQNLKV